MRQSERMIPSLLGRKYARAIAQRIILGAANVLPPFDEREVLIGAYSTPATTVDKVGVLKVISQANDTPKPGRYEGEFCKHHAENIGIELIVIEVYLFHR